MYVVNMKETAENVVVLVHPNGNVAPIPIQEAKPAYHQVNFVVTNVLVSKKTMYAVIVTDVNAKQIVAEKYVVPKGKNGAEHRDYVVVKS